MCDVGITLVFELPGHQSGTHTVMEIFSEYLSQARIPGSYPSSFLACHMIAPQYMQWCYSAQYTQVHYSASLQCSHQKFKRVA